MAQVMVPTCRPAAGGAQRAPKSCGEEGRERRCYLGDGDSLAAYSLVELVRTRREDGRQSMVKEVGGYAGDLPFPSTSTLHPRHLLCAQGCLRSPSPSHSGWAQPIGSPGWSKEGEVGYLSLQLSPCGLAMGWLCPLTEVLAAPVAASLHGSSTGCGNPSFPFFFWT